MIKRILPFLLSVLVLSCTGHTDTISIKIENPVLPVLTGKDTNPVLKIEMIRQQPADYSLQKVVISLEGTTDLNNIEHVSLFKSDGEGRFTTENLIGKVQSPASVVTFKDNFNITEDTLTFWVSVTLKESMDLSHRIMVQCKSITTDIGKVPVPSV